MILVLVAYLLLCWGAGFWLTFISRMGWPLEGRLAMGLPLGFSAAAMLTWLLAIPFGMSGLPVALGALALAVVLAAAIRWTQWRRPYQDELASAKVRWRTREPLPLVLLVVPALLFFIPFYSHALETSPAGLYAGHVLIYGDWPAHMSVAGYLSNAQQLLPPNNPWFNGANLPYSFLPDFFSGMLLHLGLDIQTSLPLISAILSVALVVLLYVTFVRLIRSRWGAFVGVLVLLLGGGLGFALLLPNDIQATGDDPLGWLGGLVNLLAAPPNDYTWMPDLGYWWRNPTIAYLVPQRNVVFGWPLGLLSLSLLWHGWRARSRREFLLAGLVVGLLPLFHANTYVDLCVVTGLLALFSFRRWREWAWFFVPAVALGAPQFYMLLPPADLRHPFLMVQLGWMASTPGHHDNWIWWWLVNTGLLVPLAAASFLLVRGKSELRKFLLPTWILFILPNLFVLQVWDWDNTKWLAWWLIPASMMIGLLLAQLASRSRLLMAAAVAVVLVQVASGALVLDSAWQRNLNNPNLPMLDGDGVALGDWARTQTSTSAVFLTGWDHNEPIRVLGARAQVMGGLVSLWTTDIDYRPRYNDVVAMYKASPGVDALLIQYGVDYVVIGPQEEKEASANITYYEKAYPMAYRSPLREYEVFKVS